METNEIKLKAPEALKKFLDALQHPVDVNIISIKYDPELDLFPAELDLGFVRFTTLFNLENLIQLVDAMEELKETKNIQEYFIPPENPNT